MSAPLRLHIGGEQAKPGWTILNVQPGPHVDHVGNCLDLGRFADGTVTAIYASHVLEHLGHRDEVATALAEFHRVLSADAHLMLSVPDMDVLCRLFAHPALRTHHRERVMRTMFGDQRDAFDLHKIGFSIDILAGYLRRAGFMRIRRVASFGLFDDASEMRLYGSALSLNVEARR